MCQTMIQLQFLHQSQLYSPHMMEMYTHVVDGLQDLQSTTIQTIVKLQVATV